MNDYEKADLEEQAEFLRGYDPYIIEEDGWEILTRILAFVLCVLGILLILNWK